MPPYMNVKPRLIICVGCETVFPTKRPDQAKWCSEQCKERPRKRGAYDPEKARISRVRRAKRPGYREAVNAGRTRRRRSLKHFINAVKTTAGCTDCGYDAYAVALDFDHVMEKRRLISVNCKSIRSAVEEMERCEVVCSNCHRVRTEQRRIERTAP